MKFGQYELIERIAVGGMAEVYRGRTIGEEGFEKAVAIKRILPHFARDERFVQMLVQEARIHAQLSHRNIVQIHDLGVSEEGEYFIVLEFVDGRDLGALLEALSKAAAPGNRLGDALALHVAIELGEGVHCAHELVGDGGVPTGLVHRDISPSNVLVSYAGEVKLSDFGLAKRRTDHSVVGSIKGKLAYMSPEQARRQPLDRRSDIFALGAVLFELLTGRRLREITDDVDGWRVVASGLIPAPRLVRRDLPDVLERLLARALAPDPRDRFPDAVSFVNAAREALTQVPRAKAGEAGELQLVLRSWLPPGSPRPSTEPSRVIRLMSEFLPRGTGKTSRTRQPTPPPPIPQEAKRTWPKPPPASLLGAEVAIAAASAAAAAAASSGRAPTPAPPAPWADGGGTPDPRPRRGSARPPERSLAPGMPPAPGDPAPPAPERPRRSDPGPAPSAPGAAAISVAASVRLRAQSPMTDGPPPSAAGVLESNGAAANRPVPDGPGIVVPPPRAYATPTPALYRPRPRRGGGLRLAVGGLAVLGALAVVVHVAVVPLPILVAWNDPAALRVTSDPPGAEVRLDGVPVAGLTPTSVEVHRDREHHALEVNKSGFRPARVQIRLDEALAPVADVHLERASVPALELLPASASDVAPSADAGVAAVVAQAPVPAPPAAATDDPKPEDEAGRPSRKKRGKRGKKARRAGR